MPTYIYNYDSANVADKAKSFQPRYLGASILRNHCFHKDFEDRRDPSIVLLVVFGALMTLLILICSYICIYFQFLLL